jgi:hypothetical protein
MKINNREINIVLKRITRNLAVATIIAGIVYLFMFLFEEKGNESNYR